MGKRAVTPETPVLLWSGEMKRADEIVVGDLVIGDDGAPRRVVDTLTGESQLYEVKQSYGDDYSVSCEHILTLKYCGHGEIHWRDNQSSEGGWAMKWYDREKKTVISKKISVTKNRTREEALKEMKVLRNLINPDPIIDIHIKDYLVLSHTNRRMMLGVKLGTSIMWNKKAVSLDPRVLGMWLGDGASRGREFTSNDDILVQYWGRWADQNEGKVVQYDAIHYGVTGSPNPLTTPLREYNLVNNKHIPEEYIVNDEETRLLVLAGLIDTDGSVEQGGCTIRITQCFEHKNILEGAQRISRSLGFRATINTRNVTWKDSNDLISCGQALTLTISGIGLERIPTLLPRKKCRSPDKDMSCYKIDVVEAGVGRFVGFEVDSNHRFLLGDFTVTHNCEQTARTVAGGDPTLKLGQLGVPYEIAEILTVPVQAAPFNIKKLTELVNNGNANYVIKNNAKKSRINLKYALFRKGTELLYGDIIYRGDDEIRVETGREQLQEGDRVKRGDEFLRDVRPIQKKHFKLELGDTVERKLQDKDYVLLNRQPFKKFPIKTV